MRVLKLLAVGALVAASGAVGAQPMTRPAPGMERPVGRPDRPTPLPGPNRPRPDRPGLGRPPHHGHQRPPYFGHHRPPYGGHRPHHRPFHYPPGYRYRRWHAGLILPHLLLASSYWFNDYAAYGLPHPHHGYRWVRYGPDLLLVNERTGHIRDVRHGLLD